MTDLINASFELFGGFFVLTSVVELLKRKAAVGIHWIHCAYFTVWGFWNLYYYPSLGQWWSAGGSVGVAVVNLVYFILVVKYGLLRTRTKAQG